MYNENSKTAGPTAQTESAKRPELEILKDRMEKSVIHYDDLTCRIKGKLQNIQRYQDPIQDPMPEMPQPETFADDMRLLINRIEDYNSRLESIVRHLTEIIG